MALVGIALWTAFFLLALVNFVLASMVVVRARVHRVDLDRAERFTAFLSVLGFTLSGEHRRYRDRFLSGLVWGYRVFLLCAIGAAALTWYGARAGWLRFG